MDKAYLKEYENINTEDFKKFINENWGEDHQCPAGGAYEYEVTENKKVSVQCPIHDKVDKGSGEGEPDPGDGGEGGTDPTIPVDPNSDKVKNQVEEIIKKLTGTSSSFRGWFSKKQPWSEKLKENLGKANSNVLGYKNPFNNNSSVVSSFSRPKDGETPAIFITNNPLFYHGPNITDQGSTYRNLKGSIIFYKPDLGRNIEYYTIDADGVRGPKHEFTLPK